MNLLHQWICSSGHWRKHVKGRLLPWALEGVELGANVLEVGPGYGATTAVLRERVTHLTCVEVDARLADGLRQRFSSQNVSILCEDATAMSLPNESFDGATCFTMLHHVPSAAQQNLILEEVWRVLRYGGVFVGTDSRNSPLFHALHFLDTLVIVDPTTFSDRLRDAGFEKIQVEIDSSAFRFRAWKPLCMEHVSTLP